MNRDLNINVKGLKSQKGIKDAFYELIANALDAGSPVLDEGGLTISDKGTGIIMDNFVVGSTSRGVGTTIGQHGLGLKEAIAILVRNDSTIRIETIGRVFTFDTRTSTDLSFEMLTLWVKESPDTVHRDGTTIFVIPPSHKHRDFRKAMVDAKQHFLKLMTPRLELLDDHSPDVHIYKRHDNKSAQYFFMNGAKKSSPEPLNFIYNLLAVSDAERANLTSDHTILDAKAFRRITVPKLQKVALRYLEAHPDQTVKKTIDCRDPLDRGTAAVPVAAPRAQAVAPLRAPVVMTLHPPGAAPIAAPGASSVRVAPQTENMPADPLTRLIVEALGSNESPLFTLSGAEENCVQATITALEEKIRQCPGLSVAEIQNSGSFFKGTAVPGFADVDLVLFLNNFVEDQKDQGIYREALKRHIEEAEFLRSASDILQCIFEEVEFDLVLTTLGATTSRSIEFANGPRSVQYLKRVVGTDGQWVKPVIRAAKYWAKRKRAEAKGRAVLKALAVELIVLECYKAASYTKSSEENRRALFRAFLDFIKSDNKQLRQLWDKQHIFNDFLSDLAAYRPLASGSW